MVDSEKLAGFLKSNKITLISKPEEADLVILNTCAFIEEAKEEAIDTIFELSERSKRLYVMGCLVERYKEILERELKEVDAFFGTESWEEIGKHLGLKTKKDWKREISTPRSYAYLKISEGCNRLCSFCAIPSIRGRYRSFTLEEIERELDLIEEKGIREVVIISQDTTYYGRDIYGKNALFTLLNKIEKRKNIKWVRLLYLYPSDISEDFVKFVADSEKILPYFDIPIQHVSDSVLKDMRRGYTKKDIYNLIENIYKYAPSAVLRTSLIVGFPSETEKDFMELIDFIKEGHFMWTGVFTYSHEEDTHAHKMEDKIPKYVKVERQKEILDVQEYITETKLRSYIGKEMEVIIDGFSEETGLIHVGRSFLQAPEVDGSIYIEADKELRQGDIVKVIIKDTRGYDMVGVVKR